MQGKMPSLTTLVFHSTRNQSSNCSPIIATVRMYCILQLAVFVFCPFTLVSIHPVNAGIQDIVPSIITLFFPFDLQPPLQLHPNSCHRALVLHLSA
jgi:hypothetical protein